MIQLPESVFARNQKELEAGYLDRFKGEFCTIDCEGDVWIKTGAIRLGTSPRKFKEMEAVVKDVETHEPTMLMFDSLRLMMF